MLASWNVNILSSNSIILYCTVGSIPIARYWNSINWINGRHRERCYLIYIHPYNQPGYQTISNFFQVSCTHRHFSSIVGNFHRVHFSCWKFNLWNKNFYICTYWMAQWTCEMLSSSYISMKTESLENLLNEK